MYIWRGKNRRDRREFALNGAMMWGPRRIDVDTDRADDVLRHENEIEHVLWFHDSTRRVMFDYLLTPEGHAEIRLVAAEIDRVDNQYARKKKSEAEANGSSKKLTKDEALDEAEAVEGIAFNEEAKEKERKKTIYEVFRKYDVDGSDSIDVYEFRKLLDEINMKLTPEEFLELFKSLDTDGGGEIDFEEFYNWFISQADDPKHKTIWGKVKRIFIGSFYDNIKRIILETEARNLLFDCAVARAEAAARKEFRIAHPPKHLCDHCDKCFITIQELIKHQSKDNKQEHVDYDIKTQEDNRRFKYVDAVFVGTKGRKMMSNRLLFSPDLGTSESRVNASVLAPYRPELADPRSHRKKQLLGGLLVQGANPSAGVRPKHKEYGLVRQYNAPGRLPTQPRLEDLFAELVHVSDESFDIVIAPEVAAPADVRFQWNGYAYNNIEIKGDFNGWRPEEMKRDFQTGKRHLIKPLGAGKYRYKFVIDGVEHLDELCSQTDAVDGSGTRCNVILVINPLAKPTDRDKHSLTNGASLSHLSMGNHLTKRNPKNSARSAVTWDDSTGPLTIEDVDENKDTDDTASVGDHKEKLREKLRTVNLRNVCLFDDGCWALSLYLRSTSVIQSLDLSFNGISDDGLRAITLALPSMPSLHTLKLNGNGFGIDGCRYLSEALKSSLTLKTLELSQNTVCDDGAECIADFIRHHASIERLFLDSCHIGDGGAHYIGDAITRNKSLKALSLAHNLIGVYGASRLGISLIHNAVMTEFYIHNNALGANGAKSFCDMLYENTTLQIIDLSNVDIVSGHSGYAIHSLCSSLKKNRHLRDLRLRNNNLNDDYALDLASALEENRGLISLDLTSNLISKQWFHPDLHLHTHLKNRVATIRTSLDRNKELQADPAIAYRFEPRKPVMDPAFDGEWTDKRKWKQINHKLERKRAQVRNAQSESERIAFEKEYVAKEVAAELKYYRHALEAPHIADFLSTIAKVISVHYQLLSKIDGSTVPEFQPHRRRIMISSRSSSRAATANSKGTLNDATDIELNSQSTPSLHSLGPPNSRGSNPAIGDTKTCIPVVDKTPPASPTPSFNSANNNGTLNVARGQQSADHLPGLLPPIVSGPNSNSANTTKGRKEKAREKGLVPCDEGLIATHRAIVAILFRSLDETGADEPAMALNPELLEQAFHNLCLPLHPQDVQSAVDGTIVRERVNIGFYRFCRYSLQHAKEIAHHNSFQRMRLLADLYFNPPVAEAKQILLDHYRYKVTNAVTRAFRAQKGRDPLYVCYYCGLRFATERKYKYHARKGYYGYEHRRHRMHEQIYEAQSLVLRRAKHSVTGSYFPSYYELVESNTALPQDYCPQVFDKMGSEGRPVGVVEPKRCVRVEDMLGEFVHINFEGKLGWVRYRLGKLTVMRPACSLEPEFSWDNVKAHYKPVYFRVKTDIPPTTSIKVRYMPLLSGEVCGHIGPGDVIECWGELGDWLQIRYGKEDCVWVLKVSGAGSIHGTYFPPPPPVELKESAKKKTLKVAEEKVFDVNAVNLLIDELHPSLQLKLRHMVRKSPCVLDAAELVVDETALALHTGSPDINDESDSEMGMGLELSNDSEDEKEPFKT